MIVLRNKCYSLRDNKKLGQLWYNTKSTVKGATKGALYGAGAGYAIGFGSKTGAVVGSVLGGLAGGGIGMTFAPVYETPEEKKQFELKCSKVPTWVVRCFDKVEKKIDRIRKSMNKDFSEISDFYSLQTPYYYESEESKNILDLGGITAIGENAYNNFSEYSVKYNLDTEEVIFVQNNKSTIVKNENQLYKLMISSYRLSHSPEKILEYVYGTEEEAKESGLTKKDFIEFKKRFDNSIKSLL